MREIKRRTRKEEDFSGACLQQTSCKNIFVKHKKNQERKIKQNTTKDTGVKAR